MKHIRKIETLHSEAMELAAAADLSLRKGHKRKAAAAYRQSLILETEAAELLAPQIDQEPSRSIMLRSAASLALDCDDFSEACRLLCLALSGRPSDSMKRELREMYELSNFRLSLHERGFVLDSSQLRLSLVGRNVNSHLANSAEVIPRLNAMVKLISRTAQRKEGRSFSDVAGLQKDYPVFLSPALAGSYVVNIHVGRPSEQLRLEFMQQPPAETIVDEAVKCLQLFSDGNLDELSKMIVDRDYRDSFIGNAETLAPDGKRVSSVGVTQISKGMSTVKAIALPKRVKKKSTRNSNTTSQSLELVGTVKFADDMDKHEFNLRLLDGSRSEPIQVSLGTMSDIVKPYWGETVQVTVERTPNRKLLFVSIQPYSTDDKDDDSESSEI